MQGQRSSKLYPYTMLPPLEVTDSTSQVEIDRPDIVPRDRGAVPVKSNNGHRTSGSSESRAIDVKSSDFLLMMRNCLHFVSFLGTVPHWQDVDTSSSNLGKELLRMKWNKRRGVWFGEWSCAQSWEDESWFASGSQAEPDPTRPAMESWAGRDLPQEVLLVIAYFCLLDRGTAAAACLTCSAWFGTCAPELYAEIAAPSASIEQLIEDVSKPDSHLAVFIRRIRLRGSIPWLNLTKLLRMLRQLDPDGVNLEDNPDFPSVYCSALPRLSSIIHNASTIALGIEALYLNCLTFTAAVDMMRLLSFFPRLSFVHLRHCYIPCAPFPASHIVPCRAPLTQLDEITYDHMGPGPVPWFLMQFWQWPHTATDHTARTFPGLHATDVRVALSILDTLNASLGQCTRVSFYVLKSLRQSSWTLLVSRVQDLETIGPGGRMDVEFHVRISEGAVHLPRQRGKTRVEDVVIRSEMLSPIGTMDLDTLMTQFQFLRTVTLETIFRDGSQGWDEELGTIHARGIMRRRTCEEAETVARTVVSTLNVDDSVITDRGIVSPFWYLDAFQDERANWLYVSPPPGLFGPRSPVSRSITPGGRKPDGSLHNATPSGRNGEHRGPPPPVDNSELHLPPSSFSPDRMSSPSSPRSSGSTTPLDLNTRAHTWWRSEAPHGWQQWG